MSEATSIRASIRVVINNKGKTCNLYDYGNATKSENEEGDISVTDWGSATEFKAVSSNNFYYRKLGEMMGIETDTSDRVLIAKDDIDVDERDKITIGDEVYEVREIKNIDPIEDDVIIAKRIVLKKHIGY